MGFVAFRYDPTGHAGTLGDRPGPCPQGPDMQLAGYPEAGYPYKFFACNAY